MQCIAEEVNNCHVQLKRSTKLALALSIERIVKYLLAECCCELRVIASGDARTLVTVPKGVHIAVKNLTNASLKITSIP